MANKRKSQRTEQPKPAPEPKPEKSDGVPAPEAPKVVRLENRIPKKRIFLADAVRDERDREFLNNELRKKCYKGRLVRVTTIKHCELVDGCWLTEFLIETK